MSLTTSELEKLFNELDNAERLCLVKGPSTQAEIMQRVMNAILLRSGVTASTLVEQLAKIASGEQHKLILDGDGKVKSRVVDPKVQMDAITKLLDLTGIPQSLQKRRNEEDTSTIDISFEEILDTELLNG